MENNNKTLRRLIVDLNNLSKEGKEESPEFSELHQAFNKKLDKEESVSNLLDAIEFLKYIEDKSSLFFTIKLEYAEDRLKEIS